MPWISASGSMGRGSSRWRRAKASNRRVAGDLHVARHIVSAALGEAALRHRERAADALQHVVEVVRDAAREMADRLQLLRLAQARLRRHQLARALLHALLQLLGASRERLAGAHLVVDVGAGCGSAWNKDPAEGVIGVQTGPLR